MIAKGPLRLNFLRKRGAISLGLEVMILIIIALALLAVLLFLLKSGIIAPLTGITHVVNTSNTTNSIP